MADAPQAAPVAAPAPESAPVDVDAKLEARATAFFNSAEKEPEAEPEPDWDPEEDVSLNDIVPGDDEGGEEAGDADEEDGERTSYGSKDDPFGIDEVPDEYARVKVDGEEQVVSVQEAVRNYTKQQAVDKRLSRAKQLLDGAEQAVSGSREKLRTYEQSIHRTFGSPERAYQFLDKHYPDVLDRVAMHHDKRLRQLVDQGHDLRQIVDSRARQRQQAELESQRRETERKAREAESKLERQERVQRVAPALKAALASTGFKPPSKEVMQDIGVALSSAERRAGHVLSRGEMQSVIERVLRYSQTDEAPAATGKPRKPRRRSPAPVQARREGRPRNGAPEDVPMRDHDGRINPDYVLAKARSRGRRG